MGYMNGRYEPKHPTPEAENSWQYCFDCDRPFQTSEQDESPTCRCRLTVLTEACIRTALAAIEAAKKEA